MPRGKKVSAEQIIGKLREAQVEIAKGQSIGQVAKKLGVTEQTYSHGILHNGYAFKWCIFSVD
ncbi:MAG TPA: hypothetical protein VGG64_09700 [Pirellulales bacterium]|jgi:hypothetical protein